MGLRKKLYALLGSNFKTDKVKVTINQGIARLAVFKNQRQARCSVARSDVLQLLNLGQHERALLRVEQVIKEQNMLDVYVMIESYFHQLIERINLLEIEKVCPEELNETVSSLIYAATRCGEFPELQEIRALFTSRFGKEFAARAADLRNNCGVNTKMIQKLSTRMPSLDSRMKVLRDIASENNIVLQIEEPESEKTEVQKGTDSSSHQRTPKTPSHSGDFEKVEGFSDSAEPRNKYKDVAAAAQAAFESAAYAASAARAAVELSRSDSHDPDDPNSPKLHRRVMTPSRDTVKSKSQSGEKKYFRDVGEQRVGMVSEKIHSMQKYASESEEEGMVKAEYLKQGKNEGEFKRSPSSSSSDSSFHHNLMTESNTFSDNELLRQLQEKEIVFGSSDDESHDERRTSLKRNPDLGPENNQTLHGKKVLGSQNFYSVRNKRSHGR